MMVALFTFQTICSLGFVSFLRLKNNVTNTLMNNQNINYVQLNSTMSVKNQQIVGGYLSVCVLDLEVVLKNQNQKNEIWLDCLFCLLN